MTSNELAAVLTPIWVELKRIADALETLTTQEPEPPQEPEPTGCQHPVEHRANFGTPNEWECLICQYRPPTS